MDLALCNFAGDSCISPNRLGFFGGFLKIFYIKDCIICKQK